MMSFDRHSLAIDSDGLKLSQEKREEIRNAILQPSPTFDYIEMNCRSKSSPLGQVISDLNSDGKDDSSLQHMSGQGQLLCDFKPLPGLILKTVDAIFEDIDSITECKKKCLEAPFQCYSFDLGEDSSLSVLSSSSDVGLVDDIEIFGKGDSFLLNDFKKKKVKKRVNEKSTVRTGKKKSVCRISHLDRSSLSHLKDPYTRLPGVMTYERNNCFGINVKCGRDNMKATFSSVKPFTGKIYSVRAPTTCAKTLHSQQAFSLDVPFFTSKTPSSLNNNNQNNKIVGTKNKEFSDCGVQASSVRGGRKDSSEDDSGNHGNQDEWSSSLVNETHAVLDNQHEPRFVGKNSSPKGLFARFSISLVLQKHALIVTSSDFDITLNCDYDLSQQRIVSNSIQLLTHSHEDWNHLEEVTAASPPKNKNPPSFNPPSTSSSGSSTGSLLPSSSSSSGILPHDGTSSSSVSSGVSSVGIGSVFPSSVSGSPNDPLTHEATFHSPVVRMSITDRTGGPVRAAEVGDPLSLRFEITTENGKDSLYDVFIKHIFADDGVDTSELELIDAKGCPTDPSIMGPLRKVQSTSSKILEAPFEAFKFPTSAIVQFRALIVPCIAGDCQPVVCTMSSSFLTSSNLAGYPTFTADSPNKASVHSFGKRSVDDVLKRVIERMTTKEESKRLSGRERREENDRGIFTREERTNHQDNANYFYSPSQQNYVSHGLVSSQQKDDNKKGPNQTSSSPPSEYDEQQPPREILDQTSSSSSSSFASDFPLKVVEERVFIEILDKRKGSDDSKEEETSREGLDGQKDSRQEEIKEDSTSSLSSSPLFDDSDILPFGLNEETNVSPVDPLSLSSPPSTSSRRRKMERHHDDSSDFAFSGEDDNGIKIPLPWIVCCVCLLCLQVIVLFRYYFASRRETKVKFNHRRNRLRDHDQESMS
jgi:hypothetical protein